MSALPAFEVPIADMVPRCSPRNVFEALEAVVDDATMDTDDPTPLFKARGEESLLLYDEDSADGTRSSITLQIKYVDELRRTTGPTPLSEVARSKEHNRTI